MENLDKHFILTVVLCKDSLQPHAYRKRPLCGVAVAVDSARGRVVCQDAKVLVLGGVRMNSIHTVQWHLLHAYLEAEGTEIQCELIGPLRLRLDCYTVEPPKF